MGSPWQLLIIPSIIKTEAEVTFSLDSFDIHATVEHYTTDISINATIYKPDESSEEVKLNYIGENNFFYHYTNDTISGLYYIIIRVFNGTNEIAYHTDFYLKTNSTTIKFQNISSEIISQNSRKLTKISGEIINTGDTESTLTLSIDLPDGCNHIDPENEHISLQLSSFETTDFTGYIESTISLNDNYILVTARENNCVVAAALAKVSFQKNYPPQYRLIAPIAIINLNNSNNYNIPIFFVNENPVQTQTKIKAIVNQEQEAFIDNILFTKSNLSFSPYGINFTTMTFSINESILNVSSMVIQLSTITNGYHEIFYNYTIIFSRGKGSAHFDEENISFYDIYQTLIPVQINISESTGNFPLTNVSLVTPTEMIIGLPISFDLIPGENKSLNIFINNSEMKNQTLNISLVKSNIILDKMRIDLMVTTTDTTPPEINVIVPSFDEALQDGVTLEAEVTDPSGVDWVTFFIREPNGEFGNVIDPLYESMLATDMGSDIWQLNFDTTQLPDGYYLLLCEACDISGNQCNETVEFSIRNWAVVELLPSTSSSKAGRTMPVKFSIRVVEAVDPVMPFVRNEELNILIYEEGNPETILQNSTFGDASTDYRINSESELYITNFKTSKKPMTYIVEIWRNDMLLDSFEFETVK